MKLALRRLLIFLVVLTMVIPAGLAYAATDDGNTSPGDEVVSETPQTEGEEDVTEIDPTTLNVKKLGDDFDEEAADAAAKANTLSGVITAEDIANMSRKERLEKVRVSIFLTDDAVLDRYAPEKSTGFFAKNYRSSLEKKQAGVEQSINAAIGKQLDVKWRFTFAVNAISAEVSYADIAKILEVKGVKFVEREKKYVALEDETVAGPNTSVTSDLMTGAKQAWNEGYTGAGRKIAIIDTGIDVTHQSFDAEAFDHAIAEVQEGGKEVDLMTAEDVAEVSDYLYGAGEYYSSKLPYVYNYVDENMDVEHVNDKQGEHGSHVAGIAAANRYVKLDGEFVDAADNVHAVGMAPDAQLVVMKVFGQGGGAYDSDYMAAIQDAVMLGCDSCNLSLGSSTAGFTFDTTYQKILNTLAQKNDGMVVSVSAGNSYSWADQISLWGDLFEDDVNYDTVGTPGSCINSFTVASAENIGITGVPMNFDGSEQKIYFTDGFGKMTDIAAEGGNDYVYIDSIGDYIDYALVDSQVSLAGKIVIVNRGELSFFEKGNYAIEFNPAAVIVANNKAGEGAMGMALSGYTGSFPMVSISKEDADAIKAGAGEPQAIEYPMESEDPEGEPETYKVTYYTGKVVIADDAVVEMTGQTAEEASISDFSSWGVPGSLLLKPEITAPGGNIYSVNGTNQTTSGTISGGPGEYESMSGTSMAAPHIAGLSAVLLQYIEETGLSNMNSELAKNYTGRAVAQSLLMSTADPMKPDGYLPVIQQGAGLANVSKAIRAGSVVMMNDAGLTSTTGAAEDGKVKVELGEDPAKDGVYTFSFTIYNTKDVDEAFELSTELFTQELDEGFLADTTRVIASEDSYTWSAQSGFDVYDVDKDGDTDKDDAQAILAFVTGEKTKDEINVKKADMDGDGDVTSIDAQLLLTWLATPTDEDGNEMGSTFIVPAKGKADVTATITVTEDLSDYYNGAYIEGYTYAKCVTSTEEGLDLSHTHSIPILGYYGNWTDASMFDKISRFDYTYYKEKYDYDITEPDPDYYDYSYADLYSYSGAVNTNYMTIKTNGKTLPFMGNPYAIEDEGFPYERLAISSNAEIKKVYYNLIRPAATLGYSVNTLDEDHFITGTLAADTTVYLDPSIYVDNEGNVQNSGTKSSVMNIAVKDFAGEDGLADGDLFRVGFYAVPEYYAMLLNGALDAGDMTDGYAGVLYNPGTFAYIVESGLLGEGSYIGYDFAIDDEKPVIDKESIEVDAEAGTLKVKASDNLNLAYMAVMNIDGSEIYAEEVPAAPGGEFTFEIPEAFADAEKNVAVFAGDYAGNEAAVAVKVNDNEGPDPYVISKIVIDPERASLFVGETADLNYTVLPITVEDKSVNWVSEDPTIAAVSESGTVHGLAPGETVVKAVSKNDEEVFGECEVRVILVEKDLESIIWDEDGKIWFSDFNTGSLPVYDPKVESDVPDLTTAYDDYGDGLMVGGTLDTGEYTSDFYSFDPEDNYSTEELAPGYMGAFDTAYGVDEILTYLPMAYVNGPDIYFGNVIPEDIGGDVYTGLPYQGWRFTESIGAGVNLAGLALDDPYKEQVLDEDSKAYIAELLEGYGYDYETFYADDTYYMPSYFFLDTEGRIWSADTIYYMDEEYGLSVGFKDPVLVKETEISTSFLFQSLYFDGEFVYWSHWDGGDFVTLYLIDPENGDMFEAGSFPAKVWPVSGLYELDEEGEDASGTDSIKKLDFANVGKSELKVTEEEREARKNMLAEELSKYELKARAEAEETEEVVPEEEPAPVDAEATDETAEVIDEPQIEETVEEPAEESEEAVPEETAEPQEEAVPEETSEEPLTEEVPDEVQAEEADQEEAADGTLNSVSSAGVNNTGLKEVSTDVLEEETEEAEEPVETVALELTESVKSTNGLMAVEYDPEALTFVGATPELGCTSVYDDDQAGIVYFAYANETAVKATSVLATLSFKAPCEDTSATAYTLERNYWVGIAEENDNYSFTGKGHNFVEEVTPATLEESGLVVSRCANCGEVEYEEEIPQIASIKLSPVTNMYSGKDIKPAVTVTDADGNVIDASNYTVTYPEDTKNIGTHKATVEMKNYYSGTKTLTYKIKGSLGRAATQVTVAKITDKTYTGSEIKPAVTVKAMGTAGKVVTLKAGTDYTVTYASNLNVGTAKVTITGKGNYAGTKNLTFKIVPKGTSLTSLTAESKGFTANWKKQSEKMSVVYVTGYEIQYSTSSEFTTGSTSSIKVVKYSNVSHKVAGLKANTKYYVRIRTYKTTNDKTFYSTWSKTMTVTTKA